MTATEGALAPDILDRARRGVAHLARDAADLRYLLEVLGLLNPGPGTEPRDVRVTFADVSTGIANTAGPGEREPKKGIGASLTAAQIVAFQTDPRPSRVVAAEHGVSHTLVLSVRRGDIAAGGAR